MHGSLGRLGGHIPRHGIPLHGGRTWFTKCTKLGSRGVFSNSVQTLYRTVDYLYKKWGFEPSLLFFHRIELHTSWIKSWIRGDFESNHQRDINFDFCPSLIESGTSSTFNCVALFFISSYFDAHCRKLQLDGVVLWLFIYVIINFLLLEAFNVQQ